MSCAMFSDNSYMVRTSSSEATCELGKVLGNACYPGLTILLHGGLGMGKTQITQGIGSALGIKRIKSPTFIIVSEHSGSLPLIHADLYRLDDFSGVDSLDLESYTESGAVLAVEWAERWQNPPKEDRWDITISSSEENEMYREIEIKACGTRAAKALSSVLENYLS